MQRSSPIAQSFDRHAASYAVMAKQQRAITDGLYRLSSPLVGRWLDVGCGHAPLAEFLVSKKSEIIGVDLAFAMCQKASSHYPAICADMRQLPIASQTIEGIFSNLAAQWSADPQAMLHHWSAQLKPGGKLALATYVDGTLNELHQAFTAIGRDGLLHYPSAESWQNWLNEAGFTVIKKEQREESISHESAYEILRYMRAIGAAPKRSQVKAWTKADILRLNEAYKQALGTRPMASYWRVMMMVAEKKA